MTDEQAVVEDVDTQATPESETQDAREENNLETLLAEFDSSTPEPTPERVETDDTLRQEFAELKKAFSDQQFKNDIDPVIKAVRGKIPESVLNDDQLLDLIDGRARREPKLQKAWNERASNPSGWNKVVTALGSELSEQLSNTPDAQATEDREAVAAAVRGSSTSAPTDGPAPDYSNMNDAEYRASVDKEHGFTPL